MKSHEQAPTSHGGFSWLVAGLLLSALFINYLDRQTLSVLVPFLPHSLKVSNIVYGRIQSLFLLAYALAMPLAGWTVDRLGSRIGLSVTVAVWSFIEMLHGTARTVTSLGRTVSSWAYRKQQRSRLSPRLQPSMRLRMRERR
jgi:MFS family permease